MSQPHSQRPKVEAVCLACGDTFWAVASEVRRGKGKTCSRSCAASLASINRDQAGSSNNNWRGGASKTTAGRTEAKRRYRAKHPEKHSAHLALNNAIRRGDLQRGVCEVCGDPKTEGHHDDYSKPLEVRWLCKRHHLDHHWS